MSWRLLMAEYPSSLLSDEDTIAALALLEWGGALTEEDLQSQSGIDKDKLTHHLLSLHNNRCVEYSGQFIKVTDRGRRLIDRLSLESGILDHLLKPIPISSDLRAAVKATLSRFRSRSFDKYLESVFAMHFWRETCSNAATWIDLEEHHTVGGLIAILINDLTTWAREDPLEGALVADSLNPEFPWTKLLSDSAPGSSTEMALNCLESVAVFRKSPTPFAHIPDTKTVTAGLFAFYQMSRNCLEVNHWRDEWSNNGRVFGEIQKSHSGKEALRSLNQHGMRFWRNRPLLLGKRDRQLLARETFVDQTIRQGLDGLLVRLLAAESISDLAKGTEFTEAWLVQLLGNIKVKCETLLGDRRSESTEDASNAESRRESDSRE